MRLQQSTLIKPVIITLVGLLSLILLLTCSRDNPFDSEGTKFISGAPPQINMLEDSVDVYEGDTSIFTISWLDTAAVGGAQAYIKEIHFDFDNNGIFEDSVPGSASYTFYISHRFNQPYNGIAKLYGSDNDFEHSALDSFRLIVRSSRPTIDSVVAPTSSAKNSAIRLRVMASDPDDSISWYLWAFDGINFSDSSMTDSINTMFATDGVKSVAVKVRDSKGITSIQKMLAISVASAIDNEGPTISFIYPADNMVVNNSVMPVTLSVSDPGGIGLVIVNGVDAQPVSGSTKNWRCTVTLVAGTNQVLAVAQDKLGNSSQKSVTVSYLSGAADTDPPQISFVSPEQDDTVNTANITISIQAIDPSQIAKILCDTTEMTNVSADNYQCAFTLDSGENVIIIRASDRVGNTGADTLRVFFIPTVLDIVPPRITILQPRANSRWQNNSVIIEGSATDASQVDSVFVNGSSVWYSEPTFRGTVTLTHGYNMLRVRVVDKSAQHNSSVDSVIVIANNPPQLGSNIDLDTSLAVNQNYGALLAVTDPDNDGLSASLTHPLHLCTTQPSVTVNTQGVQISNYRPTRPGTDTFIVKIQDNVWMDSVVHTWNVYVSVPGETKPFFTTVAGTLVNTISADSAYTDTLFAQDPNGSPLRFSLIKPSTPDSMAIDSISGRVSWTPAFSDTGLKTISAMVSTGSESDTLTWTIRVRMYDRRPVLANPGPKTVSEGQQLRFTLSATDADNDTLEYSFGDSVPPEARLQNGVFSWTPLCNQYGSRQIDFVVREKNRTPALSDTQSIIVTVIDSLNCGPNLDNPGTKTVAEGQKLSFTLSVSDFENDSYTLSMTGVPQDANLDGSTFAWTPLYTQKGEYQVKFKATQTNPPQLSDSESITITVTNTNRNPVFSSTSSGMTASAYLDIKYSDTLVASDPDGDPITFSILYGPEGLSISNDIVTWTAKKYQSDAVPVLVVATDNGSLKDTLRWNINVRPWPRMYGTSVMETGTSVKQTADSGFVFCGTVATSFHGNDVFVAKTNAFGDTLWTRRYGGTGNDGANSIAVLKDGSLAVLGYTPTASTSSKSSEFYLLRLKSNGDTMWTRTFGGAFADTGYCVIQTSDDNLLLCGSTMLKRNPSNAMLIKVDDKGNELWKTPYDNNSRNDIGYSVCESSNGYVLTGVTVNPNNQSSDVFVVRTNSTGTALNNPEVYDIDGNDAAGYGIVDAGNGAVMICGTTTSSSTGNSSAFLLNVNSYGGLITPPIKYGVNSGAFGVAKNSYGEFVLTGYSTSITSSSRDLFLVRTNAQGGVIKSATFGSTGSDCGYGVTTTSDGNFVAVGSIERGAGNSDIYMLKVDTNMELVK